jgi:hypothetical protein
LAARRVYGYGLLTFFSPQGRFAEAGGRNAVRDQQYVASLSRVQRLRYETALQGTQASVGTLRELGGSYAFSTTGCHAQAVAKVYGSDRNEQFVTAVGLGLYLQANYDTQHGRPVRLNATRRWSACMLQGTGEAFSQPTAAYAAAARLYGIRGDTSYARAFEVRISVADERCEYRVGFAQAFARSFREFVDEAAHQHMWPLLSAIREEEAAVSRAQRIAGASAEGA